MIINIPDFKSPKERKRLLDLEPYRYALLKFNGNKTRAGEWLGVTARCITYAVNRHPELHHYIRHRQVAISDGKEARQIKEKVNSYEHIE